MDGDDSARPRDPRTPSSGDCEPEISEFPSEFLQVDPQQSAIRVEECDAPELLATETPQPSPFDAITTEQCDGDDLSAAASVQPEPARQSVSQTTVVPDISEERPCLDAESLNACDVLPEASPLSCNSVFNILRLSFHKFDLFPPPPSTPTTKTELGLVRLHQDHCRVARAHSFCRHELCGGEHYNAVLSRCLSFLFFHFRALRPCHFGPRTFFNYLSGDV